MKNKNFKKPFIVKEKYSSLNYAIFLLSKKSYSEYKIKEKLKQKEYEYDDIEKTLSRLKKLNYINDVEFSKNYIRSKKNILGKNRIKMELNFKYKIKTEVFEDFLDNINFEEKSLDVYIKKYGKTKPIDNKDYRKRISFMARKGFPPKIPNIQNIDT